MDGVLKSRRFDLVPMNVSVRQALADENGAQAGSIAGFRIPDGASIRKSALNRRIQNLREDPSLIPWLMNALVVRDSRRR